MVKNLEIELNNGSKQNLAFNFNFIVIASRIMEDKEKYPKSLDDALMEAAGIIDAGLKLSDLNRLATIIFPFVFAGMQAANDANGIEKEVTESEAIYTIKNIADPGSFASILAHTFESIMPKGLPEDKKKEDQKASPKKQIGKK